MWLEGHLGEFSLRKTLLKHRIFVLVLCGLLLQASGGQAQDTIRIATEEYPPYTSEVLNHFGIDAHIVSEAFKTQGIAVEYSFFPGARSYKLARTGQYDATLPWAKRAGREADFYYSDPVINVDDEHLFFRKEMALDWNPQVPDYRILRGKRFGAIISYNYGELFQEAESSGVVSVSRVSELKQAFSMLLLKRVDVVISKERVARHILNTSFSKEEIAAFTSLPEQVRPASFDYLLVSKKSLHGVEFLRAINRGLKILRDNGKYEQFLADFERGVY
jgi:polar amino acid transport system substrate-binding protein